MGSTSGDIIAAEYLRRGHGKGILNIDLNFFKICLKYILIGHVFYKYVKKVTKGHKKNDICFHFPETSFSDELRRRIFIKKGFKYEYTYNKYLDKIHIF